MRSSKYLPARGFSKRAEQVGRRMTGMLFINDSASQRNWGDRAAAFSLRAMIEGLGGKIVHTISERDVHSSSFFEPPIAPESPTPGTMKDALRPFIPPIVLQVRGRFVAGRASSRKAAVIPATWKDFEESAKTVLGRGNPWPALPAAIEECDLAIIHGDGSMVGNGLHPRTLLFLAYLIKRHFSKPVLMVNHTADFDDPSLLEMARHVYPLFDDIVFRDPMSVECWGTLGGGRFAADTGFWFAPHERAHWARVAGRPTYFDVWPDTSRFDPSAPYLCVGGSSIYGLATDIDGVIQQWTRFVQKLSSAYAHQVVLTASDPVDAEVFRPVAAALGLPLIGPSTPVQQAVDILGNADAYVGGRWHSGIFALRGGAPLVTLNAKTFKMRALAEMAGLPSSSLPAFDIDAKSDVIAEQLHVLLDQGEILRDRLRGWAEGMSENSWDNLRFLRDSR
jgi:polysaccharide pyruvyl transferase WcaK-like protein